jgi:hypothetical protein
LNNIIEQDHRFIKTRIAASLGFRSAEGAWRTISGYEAMHLIRKGQIRWLSKGDVVGQRQFIHTLLVSPLDFLSYPIASLKARLHFSICNRSLGTPGIFTKRD